MFSKPKVPTCIIVKTYSFIGLKGTTVTVALINLFFSNCSTVYDIYYKIEI